ncbi:hypothetical protein AB0N17_03275 [Streptomyces sp. NPDC051133]|uniref:hypothetical protein n=1 Tax=Streptomyces sp. NPDC051133 TaxID=3155521 RepID=UPI003420A8AE
MSRFLAGLGAALITGGITRLFTAAEPWWLAVGGVTALICWFGAGALDVIADALDDLF